jgi:hypothetical protein
MAENDNKKPLKEKKVERQEKKVKELTEKRKAEAKKFGIDPDEPKIGPVTSEWKAGIDETMRKGVGEDFIEGLKKIQEVRQPPDVDIPTPPKHEYTIKDVRKERRAKIADMLGAFGQGLKGEAIDPTRYRDILKGGREAEYAQYRDMSKAAKKSFNEFKSGYIDEQLQYLDDIRKDPTTTESEKIQLKKLETQLKMEQAKLGIAQEQLKQLKAKPTKEEEPATAKRVTKVGGDTITQEIPLSEAAELEEQAKLEETEKKKQSEIDEAVSEIDIELSQAKLDLANMGEEGKDWWELKDKGTRNNLIAKIQSLEQQREEAVDKINKKYIKTKPKPTPKSKPKPKTPPPEGGSILDHVLFEHGAD